ncbi:MAG: aminotransferase class I/II-fold pyridoxal phosphate-dependent enzyme, partial [Pseudonocardiaceae bacterium]
MTLSSVVSETEVAAYERELAEHLGVAHVVAVSSGTTALQTALDAVGVRPGDEVLIPALTVVMSVAPVASIGARPVFVDCNADGHGLSIVADACQALGTRVDGTQAGTCATIGCFSTHKQKLLSTDEGGFLTTNDDYLAARSRAYRSHWLTPPDEQRPLSRLTHNFRLAEPLAELGRRELPYLVVIVLKRIDNTTLLLV